jgi:hypothetical protein
MLSIVAGERTISNKAACRILSGRCAGETKNAGRHAEVICIMKMHPHHAYDNVTFEQLLEWVDSVGRNLERIEAMAGASTSPMVSGGGRSQSSLMAAAIKWMPAAAMTPMTMLNVTTLRRHFDRHFLARGENGVRINSRQRFDTLGRGRQNNKRANGQGTENLPYVHRDFLSVIEAHHRSRVFLGFRDADLIARHSIVAEADARRDGPKIPRPRSTSAKSKVSLRYASLSRIAPMTSLQLSA